MDIEKKDEHPFTTIITNNDYQQKRKRCRCIWICISVTIGIILTIGIIILILVLTVFKAKKPVTTVNSVAIKDLDASVNLLPPRVSLNLSLDLNISIKNPNKVGVKYRNSSASILYKGKVVGDVPIPAGEIGSDTMKEMNLTLNVFADRLLTNMDFYADVMHGDFPISTYTRIVGKARILKLFNIRIVSVSTCALDISITNRSVVNQTCHYTNKL